MAATSTGSRTSSDLQDQARFARIIVSAWNVGAVEDGADALPRRSSVLKRGPTAARKLSCQLYQRSTDLFPGRALPASPATPCFRPHGAPAMRPGRGRPSLDRRRLPRLQQPRKEQVRTQLALDPSPSPPQADWASLATAFDAIFRCWTISITPPSRPGGGGSASAPPTRRRRPPLIQTRTALDTIPPLRLCRRQPARRQERLGSARDNSHAPGTSRLFAPTEESRNVIVDRLNRCPEIRARPGHQHRRD